MSGRLSIYLLLAVCLPMTCGICTEPPVLVTQSAPSSLVSLRTREAGILDELLVEKGSKVSEAQILLRLDHYRQDYNLEVSKRRLENRKGILMAEADLREKEAILEEVKGKHKRRQISDAQYVGAITQWELANYRLESAKDALEQAKLDFDLSLRALDDRVVKSPMAGKVVEILKTVGERVAVGDVVIKVGDFSKLKAGVPLSKDAASKLMTGGFLAVKTTPNGRPIQALIESISAVPNSTKGEKVVNLIFDNPEDDPLQNPDSQASGPLPESNLPKVSPSPRPLPSPEAGKN